jgi:hypothetical protein
MFRKKRDIALNSESISLQLANYERFNLSYYNLHTTDAHIDLFELYKILEEDEEKRSEEEVKKKQNVKLSFKVWH